MSNAKRVLFLHIPKTAGSSIKRFLDVTKFDVQRNLMLSQSYLKRDPKFVFHDPLFSLMERNDFTNTFKFSVVRNPYTRTYSFYKFIMQNNKIKMSFLQFLEGVRYNSRITFEANREANELLDQLTAAPNPSSSLLSLSLWSYTQSYYLYNDKGDIALDKIYKFENLSEFEEDFNTKLALINTTNYVRDHYLVDYTPKHIAIVKQVFDADFQNFGYSKHFDDSVP